MVYPPDWDLKIADLKFTQIMQNSCIDGESWSCIMWLHNSAVERSPCDLIINHSFSFRYLLVETWLWDLFNLGSCFDHWIKWWSLHRFFHSHCKLTSKTKDKLLTFKLWVGRFNGHLTVTYLSKRQSSIGLWTSSILSVVS